MKIIVFILTLVCFFNLTANSVYIDTVYCNYYNNLVKQKQLIVNYKLKNISDEDYLTWVSITPVEKKSDRELVYEFFKQRKGDFSWLQMMYEGLLETQIMNVGYSFIKNIHPNETFSYYVCKIDKKSFFYEDRIVIIQKKKVEQYLKEKLDDKYFFQLPYIVLIDGKIESSILTDNGYAVPDRTDGYNYYYYVRDYQGNIRAVLDEAGNVVESNGYYPYGIPYADNYTSVQPYKYGGKELDRANGLDMYDFHARLYDPIVPHFITMDELCEKYPSISPYAYCMGNPINAIDPDGRRTWRIREDGSIYDYSDKNKSFDAFVIVDSKGNTKTDSDGNEIYIKFDYGTVTDVETFSIKAEKNKQRYNMVMFHIKGDDNAQQLFEFMANPQETTNVEWSHTKIGTEESQKNIVGTASSKEHTFQANYLIKKNYTIRSDAHSHPAGSGPSPADQDTYISAKNINPITIMYVYRINENNEKEYVPVQVK